MTDEIGGRVPGTPAMQHAVAWGMQAFTAAGADSVHTEGFTIPFSWSEGATEMTATTAYQVDATKVGGGTVLSSFRVRAVSVAWAPALAPVKHVPVVDVGEGTDADFKKAGDISGKIVLVHTTVLKTWDDLFAEYTKAPPVIDLAVKGKARAVAFMATREHDILYRHTNSAAGEIDRPAHGDGGARRRRNAWRACWLQEIWCGPTSPFPTRSAGPSRPPTWSRKSAAAKSRTSS